MKEEKAHRNITSRLHGNQRRKDETYGKISWYWKQYKDEMQRSRSDKPQAQARLKPTTSVNQKIIDFFKFRMHG